MVGDVRIYLGYSHHLHANGNVFLGSTIHQYIAEKAAIFFLEVLDGTVCYLSFLLGQLQIIFLLVICYLSSDKDLKSRIAVCCMHLPLLFSSRSPFICGFDAVSSACFLARMALPHCFL